MTGRHPRAATLADGVRVMRGGRVRVAASPGHAEMIGTVEQIVRLDRIYLSIRTDDGLHVTARAAECRWIPVRR